MAAYVLGAVTDWRTTAWICGSTPVIMLVLMFFFSYESPIWLVSMGRLEDAIKSLRAYARCNPTEEQRVGRTEQAAHLGCAACSHWKKYCSLVPKIL